VKPGLSRHNIIAAYRDSHRMHGDSPAAVQWPKGRQDLRFRALTRQIDPSRPCSVLDFGCGLAHLNDYFDQHGFHVDYTGADIVPEFVDAVAARHPGARVLLLDDSAALTERYDHVVASGTFNIVEGDPASHAATVRETLVRLFGACRSSLAVNFMTDDVDFVQEGAYHVAPDDVLSFVRQTMTKRLLLDQSYMPYEFTVVAFRDDAIVRPDNVYSPTN